MMELALRFTHAAAQVLWVGALVALAVFAVERLAVRTASGRHALHLLGLILMALALPVALFLAPVKTQRFTPASAMRMPKAVAPVPIASEPVPPVELIKPAAPAGNIKGLESRPARVTATAAGPGAGWERIAPWVASAYLVGLFGMVLRMACGFAGSARLRRHGDPVEAGDWPQALRRMGDRIGVRIRPALKWSREVAAPVLIGFVKPAILLPVALASRLSPAQVEAVLAHELAHLRRRDTWALAVQRVVEALLFFHPAVWWMSHRMDAAREEACDDLVLAAGCDPADYAEALLICSECRLEEKGLSAKLASRLAATGNSGMLLRRRVLRLIGGGDDGAVRLGRTGWVLGLLLVGGVVMAIFAGSIGRADLAGFDFNNPPSAYEKGIKAADRNHRIKVDGLQFQASPLQWNQEGFLRLPKEEQGPGEELFLNLGVSGGYEVVEIRLFDHDTRQLIHDSAWQHPDYHQQNHLFVERIGSTNWLRMKEAGGKFPDAMDIWLRIATTAPGKTVVLEAKEGASAKSGGNEIVVSSLLEGSMNGKGSGPGGAMLWDLSTANNQNRMTTVNLENRGDLLRGRYHLVAITKDGARHPMDHTHFWDFGNMNRHAYFLMDVALKDLDHLELVPFKARHKFFFNGLEVPKSTESIAHSVHMASKSLDARVPDFNEQAWARLNSWDAALESVKDPLSDDPGYPIAQRGRTQQEWKNLEQTGHFRMRAGFAVWVADELLPSIERHSEDLRQELQRRDYSRRTHGEQLRLSLAVENQTGLLLKTVDLTLKHLAGPSRYAELARYSSERLLVDLFDASLGALELFASVNVPDKAKKAIADKQAQRNGLLKQYRERNARNLAQLLHQLPQYRGRTVDSAGNGIAGAVLTFRTDSSDRALLGRVLSDQNGFFLLPAVDLGQEINVAVQVPDVLPGKDRIIKRRTDGTFDKQELELQHAPKSFGNVPTVVRAIPAWGEPTDGVQVRLHSPRQMWSKDEFSIYFKTDLRSATEHVFPYYGPMNAEFFLELDGQWYEANIPGTFASVGPSPATLRENLHTWITARLWRSMSTGKPMPDFASGHHTFRIGFPLSDKPNASGQRPRAVSNPVEIEALPRDDGVSIAGNVVGVTGKPADVYRVTALPKAWSTSWGMMPETMTGTDGAFTFRGLPDGPCDVSATPVPLTDQPNMRIQGVVLKKGEPVHVTLSLEEKYSISGRFTDAAGAPQTNRNVLAIWKDPTGQATYSSHTKTDAAGRYRFKSPFEVAERILINDGNFSDKLEQRNVQSGREDVDFQISGRGAEANSGAIKDEATLKTVRDAWRAERAKAVSGLAAQPEAAWGEPVNGLSVRLRPEKQLISVKQQAEFQLDVRNSGNQDVELGQWFKGCDLEVDGKSYFNAVYNDPSMLPPIILKPGEVHAALETLRLAGGRNNDWQGTVNMMLMPLDLEPGKHTIRLAYNRTGDISPGRDRLAYSKRVELEIASERVNSQAESIYPDADLKRMRDEWEIVSVEGDGTPSGQMKKVGDRIHIQMVRLMGYHGEGNEDLPFDNTTCYTIHPGRSAPKEVDVKYWLNNLDPIRRGIYQIEGDKLTLCLAPYQNERPKQFAAVPGKSTLFVLKRIAATETNSESGRAENSGGGEAEGPWSEPVNGLQCLLLPAIQTAAPSTGGRQDSPVYVTCKLRNISDKAIKFLPHYSPLESISSSGVFRVVEDQDGKRVAYRGIERERMPPTANSFVTLSPGQTLTNRVGLSYDFSKPGSYRIRSAKTDANPSTLRFYYGNDSSKIAGNPDNVWTGKLESNEVRVEIVPGTPPSTLPNGIYRVRPADSNENGIEISRSDADGTVVLLNRLTDRFGTATMASTTNDNTRFRIDLKSAGPFSNGDDIGQVALVMDGLRTVVWSHTDPNQERKMDLSSSVVGKEAAARIADALGIKPRLRANPGHKMDVRFSPVKPSFQPGEPVLLKMEIKNVGSRSFSFMDGGRQRGARNNQFGFQAFRNGGQGAEIADTGNPIHFGGLAALRTLNPGEVFEKEVDITKWFDLSAPDTLKIDARFEMEIFSGKEFVYPCDWDDVAKGTTMVTIAGGKAPANGRAGMVPQGTDLSFGGKSLEDTLSNPDSRERFLAVERFSRLPQAGQAARLPEFYKGIPPRWLGMFVEGILSSYPHDILNRNTGVYDGNTRLWAQQLADAASTLTPEQVATNLNSRLWLDVATRARALWVFEQHPNITSSMIATDLSTRDTNAIQRAATVIQALELKTFTPRLLEIWMANDGLSESVWGALLFLRDPSIVQPLLDRVEKDPKTLVRCAGLFQGTLHNQPIEPVLFKLLNSPDPEIRYQAAYALEECTDSRLAQPAARLVKEPESRSRFAAAHMVPKLPESAFHSVRAELLPLLSDQDEQVRYYALLSFGKRKDLAAGPVILEALRRNQLAEQYKIWVMQAMSALSGNTWNYYMHEWGPARPSNQKAIEQFEAWLKKHEAAVKTRE